MLYSEFIENTGCKDTEYNYKVYKSLEALYMENDNLTKQDIYSTGKKLVDNSKTEQQIQFEKEIKEKIETQKESIEWYTERTQMFEWFMGMESSEEQIKTYKDEIKRYKKLIKESKQEIKKLKWILSVSD